METTGAFINVLESMPAGSDTKQLNVLSQFSVLVYMSFKHLQGNISEEQHTNIEAKLLQLWGLMLRVSDLSRQGLFIMFQLVYNIVAFHSKHTGQAEQVLSLQNKIIESLKLFFIGSKENELQEKNRNKLFKHSLSTTLACFQVFTSMKEYEYGLAVLRDMIQILNSVFPDTTPEYKAIDTFGKVLNPFLFSFKNPLKELTNSEINEAVKLLDESLSESTVECTTFHICKVLTQLKFYWFEDVEKAKVAFHLSVISSIEVLFSKLASVSSLPRIQSLYIVHALTFLVVCFADCGKGYFFSLHQFVRSAMCFENRRSKCILFRTHLSIFGYPSNSLGCGI